MEKSKNKQSVYEEPELHIIRLTETDTITTSGWEGEDKETEIIPFP